MSGLILGGLLLTSKPHHKGASVREMRLEETIQAFDPVAIAREHIPIVDALESGMPDLAASLMASHSKHLVEFLKSEQRARDTDATPNKTAGRKASAAWARAT